MNSHDADDVFWDCIQRVVVSRQEIAQRVDELAGQIAAEFRGRELTILAVMTGAMVFLADLIRQLPLLTKLELVSVCSYPGTAKRSQGPVVDHLAADFRGKHVLVVDDILDSGATLAALVRRVEAMEPASLRTCVLLRKARPDVSRPLNVDFVGFDIGDEFVVGYGLDYNYLYRNLPDICVLKPHCLEQAHGGQGNALG